MLNATAVTFSRRAQLTKLADYSIVYLQLLRLFHGNSREVAYNEQISRGFILEHLYNFTILERM